MANFRMMIGQIMSHNKIRKMILRVEKTFVSNLFYSFILLAGLLPSQFELSMYGQFQDDDLTKNMSQRKIRKTMLQVGKKLRFYLIL